MNTTTYNSGTKHLAGCQRVFARYDPSCPRCAELAKGAAPRAGWQADYYRLRAANAEMGAWAHACERED